MQEMKWNLQPHIAHLTGGMAEWRATLSGINSHKTQIRTLLQVLVDLGQIRTVGFSSAECVLHKSGANHSHGLQSEWQLLQLCNLQPTQTYMATLKSYAVLCGSVLSSMNWLHQGPGRKQNGSWVVQIFK